MSETVKLTNIRLQLPADFSIELDRDKINLKEIGVKDLPTKAELIIKYARIGRMHELRHNEENS